MKFFIFILTTLLFFGCSSDNAYDGENGLISAPLRADASLESLYESIYKNDANESYTAVQELVNSLQDLSQTQSQTNLQTAQVKFKAFILTQKKVEAAFLADAFSDDFLDTLGYMEYFHSGKNTDMVNELDTIFKLNTALSEALYKNSNKSITSLEYALFGEDENISSIMGKMDARRSEAALIMGEKIATYSLLIRDFYVNNESFLEDVKLSTSELINRLIDSTYKLKEWRIGEAAGLVKKYEGVVDKTKLEYYKSASSLDAIISILQTHQRIMQNGLGTIASNAGAQTQADAIAQTLQNTISTCQGFDASLEDSLSEERVKNLYNEINVLQQEYTALIASMNFTQKIIEADGD